MTAADLRRLLELAAKAAGVFLTPDTMAKALPGFEWDEGDAPRFAGDGLVGTVVWCGEDGEPAGTKKLEWRPHLDDGDSRRLQVALGISLRSMRGQAHACRWAEVDGSFFESDRCWVEFDDDHADDSCAAARMAVLRAAASIGKAMP